MIAAKVVASVLAGLGLGLLAAALTAGVETIGLAARGVDVDITAAEYAQLIAGGALAAGLFAAIGVGLGAIVRGQLATIVSLCVWLLFIEPILLGDLPQAGRFGPSASAGAIAGATQSQLADDLVAPALGVLILAAYAAAASIAGAVATTSRDVS